MSAFLWQTILLLRLCVDTRRCHCWQTPRAASIKDLPCHYWHGFLHCVDRAQCEITFITTDVKSQFPRILNCNTSYSSLLIRFSHTLADTQVKPCWTLPLLQDGYRKQFVKLTRTYCSMSCVIRSLLREEKRKEDGTHFSHTNSNIYYNNMSREKERKVHKVLWKSSIITRGWSN